MKYLVILLALVPTLVLSDKSDGETETVPVSDYRSDVFGFRFRSNSAMWHGWPEIDETYPHAVLGALSESGYGAVVMSFCWAGPRPAENAVVSVMLEQFGEEYPTDFVKEETAIKSTSVSGRYMVGRDTIDDSEFEYHIRIVMNDSCAYTLAGWGAQGERRMRRDLQKLWDDFVVMDAASATRGEFATASERAGNAYHLNSMGLYFFEARAYRDAYRFFSQASDMDVTDSAYLTNALRSLVEIEAFREAYEWLAPRLVNHNDDHAPKSWDAWLAYQNGDAEKAMRIYGELFADGYREDSDFSVYIEMLADAGLWQRLDTEFAAYSEDGMTETMLLLKTSLLSRRGRHEEALAILAEMQQDRPFNADLVYQQIEVEYEAGNLGEVLRLAESLIDNGYRSLESYYYKGDAEYQLRSYLKARESFEIALTYSPTHSTIKEYLDAINSALGEDDNSAIASYLAPVPLPAELQAVVNKVDFGKAVAGYGAFYLSKLVGFHFDGGEMLMKTIVRQIKITDDNGISNFSTLEFDFDPGVEQLYVNSVTVRNAVGEQIAVGDPDSYYITSAENGYEASNEQTVHIPVPSLAVGVVVEATVTKRISVDAGSFPLEQIYMSAERPVVYSAVFVSGDIGSIHFESQGIRKPRKKGGVLIWDTSDPLVYRWEPLQPYYDQILPWVYIGTVDSDWGLAGKNYLAEIEGKLDISKTAAQAARMVEGIDSAARRIEVLSAFVQQEVHYEAIEFGRRAYIPKTARETLRDRYGDCKDHAVLLYSMLKASDIPAQLALVNLNQQVLPGLPNIDQFDHMIVTVDTDDGRLFIDPTDKDLHLGRLSPRLMAANYALVLDEKSELIRIPEYEDAQVGLRVDREIGRDEDGYLSVVEIGRFSSYQAAELRGQLRDIETSEMLPSMQRWVADRYNDAEVSDYLVENIFDASKDLIIELQYRLPIDEDGTFEVPGFFETHYFQYERVAERRFPFEQVFPLRVSAVTALKFGAADTLSVAADKPDSDETRFGNWRKRIEQGPDSWVISLDYVADTSRFDPDDYRDFAEFHRRLVGSIEQPLILN
jgi:transglutaminase-like putative cysteine protease/tetratricopeptide (TPR) repeat protein